METKIKDLIEKSELNQMQKNIAKGFIDRATAFEEENKQTVDLIKSLEYKLHSIKKVCIKTENYIIYQLTPNEKDEWSIKYPFRSIIKSKDNWFKTSMVSHNIDVAVLVALQELYLGANSDFADFSMKILEIPQLD